VRDIKSKCVFPISFENVRSFIFIFIFIVIKTVEKCVVEKCVVCKDNMMSGQHNCIILFYHL